MTRILIPNFCLLQKRTELRNLSVVPLKFQLLCVATLARKQEALLFVNYRSSTQLLNVERVIVFACWIWDALNPTSLLAQSHGLHRK